MDYTDRATFVEPLATALQIQQQVNVGADDRVFVVGDGKLGQLVAQTLAIGRHEHKLELLAQRGAMKILLEIGEG
jgi:threonine dehydrogenase-like Zn-dependent dehydrogenase|tara:strand:+ start:196 stop:420 length:225 start_codon:yes stop_codon:yes gene_type:complete